MGALAPQLTGPSEILLAIAQPLSMLTLISLVSKFFLALISGPRISSEMADLIGDPLSEQFQHDSLAFLEWFTAANGTRRNPKLELADLRASAAGRGVSKTSCCCSLRHILILLLRSCQSRHRRRRRTLCHSPLPRPRHNQLRPTKADRYSFVAIWFVELAHSRYHLRVPPE